MVDLMFKNLNFTHISEINLKLVKIGNLDLLK